MFKEYISGSIASAIQTISMYPLDTLKIYNQSNKCVRNIGISCVYKGIKYPLLFDILGGSLLFGTYYNLKKEGYCSEVSSIITGIIIGGVLTPIEIYKTKKQIGIDSYISPAKGFHLCAMREIVGNYIYFDTYDDLRKYNFQPCLAGGISGGLMWTVIYPIDYIKTNYIINSIDIRQFIKQNYRNLYNGYKYCILRAVPANMILFEVYEFVNDLL